MFSFFLPIHPTQIRLAEEDGRFKGFCLVDFASKADLVSAMAKNNVYLQGRRVTMRVADKVSSSTSLNFYFLVCLSFKLPTFFRTRVFPDVGMEIVMVSHLGLTSEGNYWTIAIEHNYF